MQARLIQGGLLKKVLDATKDLVTDANFDCSQDGFNLQVSMRMYCTATSLLENILQNGRPMIGLLNGQQLHLKLVHQGLYTLHFKSGLRVRKPIWEFECRAPGRSPGYPWSTNLPFSPPVYEHASPIRVSDFGILVNVFCIRHYIRQSLRSLLTLINRVIQIHTVYVLSRSHHNGESLVCRPWIPATSPWSP